MKPTFQRKVSPGERMFMLLAETDPPFCNQMILEGTGVVDEKLWKKAVEEASEANPGSRLLYKGRSVWNKWVDSGITPPIRIVDGSKWSGYDPEGASFLFDPLPFRTSHSCEVLVVKGSPPRVVFRTLHATMDGGGTWMWAQDIFRSLRNEPLTGWNSTQNDKDLLDSLNLPPKKPERPMNCLTPTGRPEGDEPGFVWNRVTLQGKFPKLLPRVSLVAAKEARKHGQGNVRIVCPVELRRRVPDTTSTANLTSRIFLDIPPDATIESISQDIKKQLDNMEGYPKFSTLMSAIPSAVIKRSYLNSSDRNRQRAYYKDSGTVSNGGLLQLDFFHGGGFEGKGFFWIPPLIRTKPFFISTVGYENTLEVVTAMPKVLATNGRMDKFVSNIISELKPK